MKRLLLTLSLLATLVLPSMTTAPAAAINIFGNCGSGSVNGTPTVCKDGQAGQSSQVNPAAYAVGIAIKVLSFIIGVAAVITIIVSGIRMMMASGDAKSFTSARSNLIYALVGLAVAATAELIVSAVISQISK